MDNKTNEEKSVNIFPDYIQEITHVIPVINEEGKYDVIIYLTEERKVMVNTYDILEEASVRVNCIFRDIYNFLEENNMYSLIPVYENDIPVKFTFFLVYDGYFFNNIYQPSFRINNNGTISKLVVSSSYYPSITIDNYLENTSE